MGRTIAKFRPGPTWFDDRRLNVKRRYFLDNRFNKAFDPELGGVVEGVPRVCNLATIREDLNDPTTLFPHVGNHGPEFVNALTPQEIRQDGHEASPVIKVVVVDHFVKGKVIKSLNKFGSVRMKSDL